MGNAKTRRSVGAPTPVRLVLLAACLALLAAAVPPGSASAEIVTATNTQKAVCEALGGGTEIERQQLHDIPGVDIQTKTTCKGGLLDGMTCTNTLLDGKTVCSMPLVWQPIDVPVVPITGGIYDGFVVQQTNIDQILAGLEAGLNAEEILGLEPQTEDDQNVSPGEDEAKNVNMAAGKSKKHKHGKKRGKGRKR